MTGMEILAASAAWLAAGFVNGVTSLGGNMVGTPAMTFLMDGRSAIIFGCLAGTSITVMLALLYCRHVRPAELALLVLSNMAGVPAGTALLAAASPKPLMLAAGLLLVLFVAWQIVMKRLRTALTLPLWTSVPAGFLCGLLMGATSMGGAVMGIYVFLRRMDKETTIGTVNAMAALAMLFLVFFQWRSGLYTPEILSGASLPAAAGAAGVLLSLPVIRRIDVQLFRTLLIGMIAVAGIVLLARGFMA